MKLKGIDKLKSSLGELSLSDFCLIRRLILEHEEHTAILYLLIATDKFDTQVAMELKFDGVSNFRINALGDYESRVDGFDIRDISNDGWEDKLWEVIDFEDDVIHWYSKDAEIINVEYGWTMKSK